MYHHCCSYLGWFEIVQKVLCGRSRHGGGFSNQQSDCTNVILSNTDMHPTIMYNASKYGSININAWFMHGDWICMVGYISCSMAIHSTQCLTFQDKNTSSPRSVPGRFRTCIYIHDNASEVWIQASIIPALQLNMYQRYSEITSFAHSIMDYPWFSKLPQFLPVLNMMPLFCHPFWSPSSLKVDCRNAFSPT